MERENDYIVANVIFLTHDTMINNLLRLTYTSYRQYLFSDGGVPVRYPASFGVSH